MFVLTHLFETCLPSQYSPLFLLHAVVLIHPHFGQGAALVHLDSLPLHNLVLWKDGSVRFPFGKAALAYLPTALFVALRPHFPFQQTQYAQVFLLKLKPFCTLFAGLGSTNKSATSLLLLSNSRSVLAILSSPLSFLSTSISLADLAGTVFFFLLFYQAAMGPRTLVSPRGTTRLMSWPNGERYVRPLQSIVVSLL